MLNSLDKIFALGGPVMWPLAALSVISLALTLERAVFWWRTNSRGSRRAAELIAEAARAGDVELARQAAAREGSLYGRFAAAVLRSRGPGLSAGLAAEVIERLRPGIERSGTAMATIIAAAPLLGILGTVTGIIRSFRLLGGTSVVTDPGAIAGGIGEALYTTAFGLIVALVTLFPHAVFRAQSERCLARLEALGESLTGGR